MDVGEVRRMVVTALQDAAGALDDPAFRARLRSESGDVSLAELGVDSLDLVDWALKISERAGVEIEAEDLAEAGTLSRVVGLVVGRVGARD